MTKEIKFRAWDKKEEKLLDWADLSFYKGQQNCGLFEAFFDKKLIIQQYTGLKDKNGKEIYEGDIVKNNNENWEIYYDEGAYRLRQVGKNGNFLLLGEPQHSEIIGNIYEHPELIKN